MFDLLFLGLRRKLQHGRALAFAKMREQHDLSIGKFQRIMVRAGVVHVHLPKSSDLVRQRPGFLEQKPEPGEMTLNFILKSDLGAWKEAHSHPRLFSRRKSACGCVPELRRDQLVADPGGPRRNAVQAVVAHIAVIEVMTDEIDPRFWQEIVNRDQQVNVGYGDFRLRFGTKHSCGALGCDAAQTQGLSNIAWLF
jgi:hypothetical protein